MKVVLDENAKLPTKAHSWDAGWDLYAKEDFVVPACTSVGEVAICVYTDGYFFRDGDDPDDEHKDRKDYEWTTENLCVEGCASHDVGVHMAIPKGFVGFLKSKSGLNVKHGLTTDGVIDSGYTGSIVVKLYNHTDVPYKFHKGDKITQLVILPIGMDELELVDSLDETERGDGGFGSSGK